MMKTIQWVVELVVEWTTTIMVGIIDIMDIISIMDMDKDNHEQSYTNSVIPNHPFQVDPNSADYASIPVAASK